MLYCANKKDGNESTIDDNGNIHAGISNYCKKKYGNDINIIFTANE